MKCTSLGHDLMAPNDSGVGSSTGFRAECYWNCHIAAVRSNERRHCRHFHESMMLVVYFRKGELSHKSSGLEPRRTKVRPK